MEDLLQTFADQGLKQPLSDFSPCFYIDEPTELTDHERYKVLTQRAQKRSARTAKRLMKKAGQE